MNVGTISGPQTISDVLKQLIAFDADDRAIWPVDLLRQQLRGQLLYELRQSDSSHQRVLAELTHSTQHPLDSFEDLLVHPHPPVELLQLTKDFAKLSYADRHSPLAPEVSLLLYYGCIVVAMIRCRQRISSLGDDDLRQGLDWAIRQPWVEDRMRKLLQEGMAFLHTSRL